MTSECRLWVDNALIYGKGCQFRNIMQAQFVHDIGPAAVQDFYSAFSYLNRKNDLGNPGMDE